MYMRMDAGFSPARVLVDRFTRTDSKRLPLRVGRRHGDVAVLNRNQGAVAAAEAGKTEAAARLERRACPRKVKSLRHGRVTHTRAVRWSHTAPMRSPSRGKTSSL
jgi:hypothetical protein